MKPPSSFPLALYARIFMLPGSGSFNGFRQASHAAMRGLEPDFPDLEATRRSVLETKSIARLLSLLELGGRTVWVRVYPSMESSSQGSRSGVGGTRMLSPSDAPWFADLDVRAGILQSCAVFSATGECWLVGEEALRFLDQIGWLSYDLLPASPSASLPPASDVGRSEETRPSPGSGAPTLRAEA